MNMNEKAPVVLIHGCHLQAHIQAEKGEPTVSWEEIEFGSSDSEHPNFSGRVAAGLRLALLKKASHVIFSTGASEKEGVKEGKYIYEETLRRVESLARLLSVAPAELRDFLETRSIIDIESQNTVQELHRNIEMATNVGADEIYLTTSAWHVARVTNEAAKVVAMLRSEGVSVPLVFTHAAEGETRGTAVVEAPHRGDTPRPAHPLYDSIARFYRLPASTHEPILSAINEQLVLAETRDTSTQ